RALDGDFTYLGPGQYYRTRGSVSTQVLTGETSTASELRAMAPDAAQWLRETMDRETIAFPTVEGGEADTPRATAAADLPRAKAGDIKSRVPDHTLITACRVYPNNSGICGWVAGSIVTRYWHARSSGRKLLPTNYRDGTNMTKSPN